MELRDVYSVPVEERQSCELKPAKEPTITENMAHTQQVLQETSMEIRSMYVMLFGDNMDCREKFVEPNCAMDNSRMIRSLAIEIREMIADIRRRL